MFLSKSAVTLLSTVGASSVPLISVVALYKIKSFSQGGNVEISPSTSTEENVIAEETTPIPTPPPAPAPAPEIKQPEAETTPPSPPVVTPDTNSSPPVTPPKPQTTKSDSETVVAVKGAKTPVIKKDDNDDQESTKKEEKEENPTDLLQKMEQIMKDMLNNELNPTTNNEDISKRVKQFNDLLKVKEKTIKDKTEKQSINQVIEALTKLEGKFSDNKS